MTPPVEPSRIEQRAERRWQTDIRCVVDDGEVERHTRLWDLSVGGARILTASPPRIGGRVAVRFCLADGRLVQTQGEVVWRSEGFHGRGGVIGVRFTHVSDERAVRALLEQG